MKQKTPKILKPRRKISFGGWVLILSLSIVVISGAVFAWILIDALSATGTVTVGNRFDLELKPSIEKTKLTEIKTALDAQTTTVKSSVNLRSATLRISVQVKSELTDPELQATILSIKDLVNTSLPLDTYFTSTPDIKMYDLEINVFNSEKAVSTETFVYHYFILSKNANMTTWRIQEVSLPVNPTLAAKLKASLNPAPTN